MAYVMTNKELAEKCRQVAENHKTLYVLGCFGAPMTGGNVTRYSTNLPYNRQAERAALIRKAANQDPPVYGFDCVNLIKGILWGWNGSKAATYGGAKYCANNVPDTNADGMIAKCAGLSADFSNIEVGEAVWIQGHIGVYIGGGLAVECTPRWADGVQITACNCSKAGYNRRDWTKHGKLPYVDYGKAAASPATVTVNLPQLSSGAGGSAVKAMQAVLIGRKYPCGRYGADGSYGADTRKAVEAFQRDNGLTVDGICGANTWRKLLGAV